MVSDLGKQSKSHWDYVAITFRKHRLERVERQYEGMESLNRLVTVQELANYLGVPVATIYTWRYRQEGPPGFRVGRHLRFRWSDIQEWIAQQRETA